VRICAFVFARGGSKAVPGKNIREFAGKPLLAYAIDLAKSIHEIQEIYVSTDSESIAAVARNYGATVIPRPKKLAQDNSPEWLAWRHAVDWVEKKTGPFDMFVSLPATSPLRAVEDVTVCMNLLDSGTDIVITIAKTNRSPWFNMVRLTDNGYAKVFLQDEKTYIRRQDVPMAFDMTTVAYVTYPGFIRSASGIFDGRVKAAMVPEERALDIDTEQDFRIGEFLIREKRMK
jgi:N-acylneuraminate cytidylyltransferase